MTFEEFWANATGLGLKANDANRAMAISAWDSAICSAQAILLGRGKRDLSAISKDVSNLHTWVEPS